MGTYTAIVRSRILPISSSKFILSLFAVGLVFRLWQLKGSFWYDEAFSAWLVTLTPENLVIATFYDVHPPAYYFLLWFINHLAGNSEPVLRLPSVIAGLWLIWLVYRLGNELLLPEPVVLLATAITTFAPFQVYYSQEARFYALQMVCIALAGLGVIRGRWWLLGGSSVVALYLHNVSIIYVVAIFAVACVYWWPQVKPLFAAGIVLAIGFLPGGIYAFYQARAITNNYWIPGISSPGRILALLDDIIFMMPGSPFVIATAIATCTGLIFICLNSRLAARQKNTRFLLLATFLPVVLLTAVSMVWQPILISRILAPITPFYYLLLAWSVTQSRPQMITWYAVTLPALIAVLTGMLLGEFGHRPINYKYLSLYDNYRPGDAIYHANPGSYLTFKYYRPDIPQFVWPQPQSGGLAQMLEQETRDAMGMAEIDFDLIKCVSIVTYRQVTPITRWWILEFNGPSTTQAEMDYIDAIKSSYKILAQIPVHRESMVDAWLYLIEPNCN